MFKSLTISLGYGYLTSPGNKTCSQDISVHYTDVKKVQKKSESSGKKVYYKYIIEYLKQFMYNILDRY